MKRKSASLTVLAVGACAPLVLGNPASADELTDLKAQMQTLVNRIQELENKQRKIESQPAPPTQPGTAAAVTGGDFPGSFKIPGLNTSVKIGGYVKGDVIYDANASFGGDQTDFSAIPLNRTAAANRQGQTRVHARQTRANIETRTPTDYGQVRTFIEGDFFGAGGTQTFSNSTVFRIRHAYGEFGPVLAGQTWSNFMDLPTYGDTIDFGGPAGVAFIRQGQVRYTLSRGPLTFTASAENPAGDFFANANKSDLPHIPDVTAKVTYDPSWGHLAFAVLGRDINTDNGAGAHGERAGYALLSGAAVNLGSLSPVFGKDKLQLQSLGGDGLGRYLEGSDGTTGAAFDGNRRLITIPSWGAQTAYTHFWSDAWRSVIVYGHNRFYNDHSILPLTSTRSEDSLHVNLQWSPIPQANIGFEYIYGLRKVDAPATRTQDREGTGSRFQVGLQYFF